MKSFRNSDLPASSRAVQLVRIHHGIPLEDEVSEYAVELEETEAPTESLRPRWKEEARENHLRARRRSLGLEDIPEEGLPAILEINGGRNFVVLKEKCEDGYLIQFPDTRESVVGPNRLSEVYDGNCVFLNPRGAAASREHALGSFWRKVSDVILPS